MPLSSPSQGWSTVIGWEPPGESVARTVLPRENVTHGSVASAVAISFLLSSPQIQAACPHHSPPLGRVGSELLTSREISVQGPTTPSWE